MRCTNTPLSLLKRLVAQKTIRVLRHLDQLGATPLCSSHPHSTPWYLSIPSTSRVVSYPKDYERKVQTSETLIQVAMIRLLVGRLGRKAKLT